MRRWLLYPTLSAPMPFQMAFDEILFRRTEELPLTPTLSPKGRGQGEGVPILRFYFSSDPWVTVGYSDREREAKGAGQEARDNNLPVCRRLTGGGQVLHGKDLIFSVIARKEADESFRSVRISYLKIHEAVKTALENLGASPRFYRCDENLPKGKDCFRFPIATDLAMENRKIAGGAQKRSCGALLHQESVQTEQFGAEPLIGGLRAGFEKIFAMRLELAELDPRWLQEAEKLAERKYGQEIGQSPGTGSHHRPFESSNPLKNFLTDRGRQVKVSENRYRY